MMDADFLTAIAAAPEDDTIRLAYADWLEEREPERAEFIRVQIELEPLRGICFAPFQPSPPPTEEQIKIVERVGNLCNHCRACLSRAREHTLRSLHADTWALALAVAAGIPDTPMYGTPHDSCGNPRYHNICSVYASDHSDGQSRMIAWTFRRGFIESVSLKSTDWRRYGPEILRACPTVREVRLTDKQPLTYAGQHPPFRWVERNPRWQWRNRPQPAETEHELFTEWFELLDGKPPGRWHYDTAAEAHADLSRVLLTWACHQQPTET